jgi:hypothetical protein
MSREQLRAALSDKPKRSKYGAKATTVDGIRFASKKEATRYVQLKLLERAGEVKSLELQRSYPLVVDGVLITTYRCDFRYLTKKGQLVVEDTKGFVTPEFKIKAKLFLAIHKFAITET